MESLIYFCTALTIEVLTSSERASVPKSKTSVVSFTFVFVVLIILFHLSSDYNEDMSKVSVCYLQFHHINNKGFVPSSVYKESCLMNYILF